MKYKLKESTQDACIDLQINVDVASVTIIAELEIALKPYSHTTACLHQYSKNLAVKAFKIQCIKHQS